MVRPKRDIPLEDIKGLKTLIHEGFTQNEIAEYYALHGIKADQATISRRIQELKAK